MQALDMIQPGFRALYEAICVGNKSADAQWVFFEGYLLEPGLGEDNPWAGNLKSAWGHKDYLRKSVGIPAYLWKVATMCGSLSPRLIERNFLIS